MSYTWILNFITAIRYFLVLLIICGYTWNIFDTAVSAHYCKVERSAWSLTLNDNSETVRRFASAVSSLLAMPSGTNAPAGSWSSGSVPVRYVRKTVGGHNFLFSNRKMKNQTVTPGFDVIHSYIDFILFYKNLMTFRWNARISSTKKWNRTSGMGRR